MVTIAVDAMGGDKAPVPEVEGAIHAARQFGHRVLLVGDKAVVQRELDSHPSARQLPIEVVHAPERITMDDHAAKAARSKRNSSMHVSARLVATGKADGFISAGNTGACMAIAKMVLGKLPGVDRPDVTSVDGFRQFLLRLLLFLRDQFVYDDLGHWPGLAWPHGAVDAYARHVAERLGVRDLATFRALWPLVLGATPQTDRGCPCGSPRSYDRCHRRDVETLLWLARHTDRADIAIAVEESLHAA